MTRRIAGLLVFAVGGANADRDKLSDDQKIAMIRGLTAEYATVKSLLPRSKKTLEVDSEGAYDKKLWAEENKKYGLVARLGDTVQVTKIDIGDDRITMEINGGFKTRRKWYEGIQVGVGGGSTTPVGGNNPNVSLGTTLAVTFGKSIPVTVTPQEVKKILAPVLDFEKRSVTESYVETLPPEMQLAIKEKRAIEGMDREQVLLAMGRPQHKSRETKDGLDTEDWVFGVPPGKVTFVTFANGKVIKVKDTYAGLGGSVAERPRTP
jgi:hypothetical protein